MRRILFVDRDGTLIEEPADFQIDSFDKLAFVPGVVAALRRFVAAGYELVMVTNQDGLGSASFPQAAFDGPHRLMMQVFASQGVPFAEVLIDHSLASAPLPTRKPGTGLVTHWLARDDWQRERSAMVGDRASDMQFAANLGVRGFLLGPDAVGWDAIAHTMLDAPRCASVHRHTRETRIRCTVDLDAVAAPEVRTGLAFFDHMLAQLGQHGGFALNLICDGDVEVDEHHTVEDCALALGQALRKALGDKRGIARYGQALAGAGADALVLPASEALVIPMDETLVIPMDEALVRVALDLSGRAHAEWDGAFPRERVGELPTELVPHFFASLAQALGATLHVGVRGSNAHHMVEACFKGVARALREALRREGDALPSTKGAL